MGTPNGPKAETNFRQTVKRDGMQRIETGKQMAAEQIEGLADAIDVAGVELDKMQPTLAGYAAQLADGIGSLATRLRTGSVDELTRDARRFATQSPALFLLGSAALGVIAVRFLKASSDNQVSDESHGDSYDGSQSYSGESQTDYSGGSQIDSGGARYLAEGGGIAAARTGAETGR